MDSMEWKEEDKLNTYYSRDNHTIIGSFSSIFTILSAHVLLVKVGFIIQAILTLDLKGFFLSLPFKFDFYVLMIKHQYVCLTHLFFFFSVIPLKNHDIIVENLNNLKITITIRSKKNVIFISAQIGSEREEDVFHGQRMKIVGL